MTEMIECAKTWRENGKVFREEAGKIENKTIKRGLESIAKTFEVNARILEVIAEPGKKQPRDYSSLGVKLDW